jgi:PAS domain S-box-containing protein
MNQKNPGFIFRRLIAKISFRPTGFIFVVTFLLLSTNGFAKTIKVGIYQNSPKVFQDEKGRAQGIFVDVLNYIAKNEGWEIEYVFASWREHLDNIQNGKIDLLADVAWSESRDSALSFNKILVMQSWLQVFVYGYNTIYRAETLADKRVGVLSGSSQEEFMRKQYPVLFGDDCEVVTFIDYQESIDALTSGRIDAVVADRFFFYSDLRTDSIIPTSVLFMPEGLFYATKKNQHPDILEAIDKHLAIMKNDPNSVLYKSLRERLMQDQTFVLSKTFKYILIISGFVFLHVLFMMFLLRYRVKQKTRELLAKSREFEEKERNYREIYNTTRDAIYIHDIDSGEIIDVNQTMVKMFGFDSKEEVLLHAKTPPVNKHPDFSDEKAYEKIKETREKGVLNFEWFAQKKSGEGFWVEVTLLKTSIAGIERILAFVHDIDERKRMEKEAEIARALFHTLAMHSPVGIFRTNQNGHTIFVNPAWSQMTGVSAEEANGYGWVSRIHPDDRDMVLKEWQERMDSRVPSPAEYRLVRNDGTVVWVLGNAVPDFSGGEFQGYVGTMTDITMVKETELEIQRKNEELILAKESAEESDKLKSSFLANLSHEIRTPMNAIAGFASLLDKPGIEIEKIKKFATIIQQSTNQLLLIINDIIDISMIETKQMGIRYEELNLAAFFEQLASVFWNQLPHEKELELIFNLPEDVSEYILTTDRAKLEQILTNLYGNAVKYSERGRIMIGFREINDHELLFFVEDNGLGIPKEEHDLVFERFYRCNHEKITSEKGSGLGLAICKAYVEMLSGKIWLESEPDKGSTFFFTHTFTKKISAVRPDKTEIETTITESVNRPKVLLVEDESVNLYFLQTALAEYKFELYDTDRAAGAVELCREHGDFQLVFMDVKLTDGSGIDATIQIKKEFPDLPIVIQTAYALPEDRKSAMQAGADDFLEKPISLKRLKEVINKYLSA